MKWRYFRDQPSQILPGAVILKKIVDNQQRLPTWSFQLPPWPQLGIIIQKGPTAMKNNYRCRLDQCANIKHQYRDEIHWYHHERCHSKGHQLSRSKAQLCRHGQLCCHDNQNIQSWCDKQCRTTVKKDFQLGQRRHLQSCCRRNQCRC